MRGNPEIILIAKEGADLNRARRLEPEWRALNAAYDAFVARFGDGEAAAFSCRRAKLHTEKTFKAPRARLRATADALFGDKAA